MVSVNPCALTSGLWNWQEMEWGEGGGILQVRKELEAHGKLLVLCALAGGGTPSRGTPLPRSQTAQEESQDRAFPLRGGCRLLCAGRLVKKS